MKQVTLKAEIRKTTGTGAINKIKSEGLIPAVVYGKGKDATSLVLKKAEFEQTFKKNNVRAIYKLDVVDGTNQIVKNTLIKEVQHDPIKLRVIHVDFYEYDEHKKIRTMIPVITKGTPIGLKSGGILTHVKSQIEVECLPIDIPEHVIVDVTNLDVHDSVRVTDIHFEKAIHVIDDPHDVVISIAATKAEEAAAATEETAAAEPEVMAKGKAAKPAEGAAAPAAAAAPKAKK
ncbi:MAG: 50S ribosomal protein L25 [Candidatus Wallbacteria bacterium]